MMTAGAAPNATKLVYLLLQFLFPPVNRACMPLHAPEPLRARWSCQSFLLFNSIQYTLPTAYSVILFNSNSDLCITYERIVCFLLAGGQFVEVGRFDYTAMDELFVGTPGFLITCQFNREKSATKSASTIITRCLEQQLQANGGGSAPAAAGDTAVGPSAAVPDGNSPSRSLDNNSAIADGTGKPNVPLLSIVKVACNGIVVLKLSSAVCDRVDVVKIARRIAADVDSGVMAAPPFCQRICPFTTTCKGTLSQLHEAAQRTVQSFAASLTSKQPQVHKVEFGVGFNCRVANITGQSNRTTPAAASSQPPSAGDGGTGGDVPDGAAAKAEPDGKDGVVERNSAIQLLATSMQQGLAGAAEVSVNLKHPQYGFMLDLAPVGSEAICMLSILPEDLIRAHPRLAVRSLAPPPQVQRHSNNNATNAAHKQKHQHAKKDSVARVVRDSSV